VDNRAARLLFPHALDPVKQVKSVQDRDFCGNNPNYGTGSGFSFLFVDVLFFVVFFVLLKLFDNVPSRTH
jgi:hypothetical protein